MKKLALGICVLVCALFASPILAEEEWHYTDAAFGLHWTFDSNMDDDTKGQAAMTWMRRVGERNWIGGSGLYALLPQNDGFGLGPIWQYDFAPGKRGGMFVRGTAQYLGGVLDEQASFILAEWIGWKQHIAKTGSIDFAFQATQPVNSQDGADIDMHDLSFLVGFTYGFDFNGP